MAIPDDEIERYDWNLLSRRLTTYARWRLGWDAKVEDAEEIAQQAIATVLDPEYREWNPGQEDLMWHLQSNVNGIISNLRTKKARSMERLRDLQPETSDERFRQANPNAKRVERRLVLEVLHDHAEARDDTVAQNVVMDVLQGDFDAAELAARLKVPVQKVYDARERLKRYLAAILREG